MGEVFGFGVFVGFMLGMFSGLILAALNVGWF